MCSNISAKVVTVLQDDAPRQQVEVSSGANLRDALMQEGLEVTPPPDPPMRWVLRISLPSLNPELWTSVIALSCVSLTTVRHSKV
eukprot:4720347-Amphidinium_carterae.1